MTIQKGPTNDSNHHGPASALPDPAWSHLVRTIQSGESICLTTKGIQHPSEDPPWSHRARRAQQKVNPVLPVQFYIHHHALTLWITTDPSTVGAKIKNYVRNQLGGASFLFGIESAFSKSIFTPSTALGEEAVTSPETRAASCRL